jgi:predicted nucleic acid-binding protein
LEQVVVDANVFVKWFVEENYTEEALLLRQDYIAGRVKILTPAYALLEVADAFRKYVARKIINANDAIEALNILQEFSIQYLDLDRNLLTEALKYSMENHLTVYDAYYITIARKLNSHFYTADEKLLTRIQAKENIAHHIKEYRSKTH